MPLLSVSQKRVQSGRLNGSGFTTITGELKSPLSYHTAYSTAVQHADEKLFGFQFLVFQVIAKRDDRFVRF